MTNVVHLHQPAGLSMSAHRTDLIQAIDSVRKVIQKSPTPVLQHVLLRGDTQAIKVIATDADTEVASTIHAVATKEGFATTLHAATFLKILKSTTADLVNLITVDEEANEATIDIGDASYVLPTLPADDFPAIPGFAKAKVFRFKIPGSVLWNAIDGTMGAICTEETRYYLNGIYLHARDGKIAFVTTDGHRLYFQATNVTAPKGFEGVIIPAKAAKLLHGAMLGGNCPAIVDVALCPDMSIATFDFEKRRMHTKLIDGTFPDYQRVIPVSFNHHVSLSAKDFIKRLDAVTAAAGDTTAVKMTITENLCRLSINSPGSGRSTLPVPCVYEGEGVEIGFNAEYLKSIVNKAGPDGGPVVLQIVTSGDPARVTGTAGGWHGVLMPTRV